MGHETIIEGDGNLIVGKGPVRTGITSILPRGMNYDPVFAGSVSYTHLTLPTKRIV